MPFQTRREGDIGTISVEGQLIVGNRREFDELVRDDTHKDLGDAPVVVVDFAECGYIDADGLGALVSAHKRVRQRGRELKIANLNDDLKTLFELTKLDTLFEVVENAAVSAGTTFMPSVGRTR